MENCCFNTLPRHNSQHELIENSLVIIQSIWNNDSITINLFPKNSSHGYTGTIETTTLSLTADSLEIDFSEFMAETKSALSSENGLANFTYCLEQSSEHTSFKWCKVTEGGFRIEYGNVALRVQDNLKEEMIIDALSINKTKEQKIEEQKQEIQLMNVDYKRMEDVLEKCIEEKNNLEEKLLTKFAALLNAKKEKIVELQHALANRTGDEEDYESDGSDDDSDIEYSSQRYVADVPTPGPSTSHQDDNTVIFPKRMKPNPENKVVQQVQQVQQVQRSNSTDSTDIYDRETQVLIDDICHNYIIDAVTEQLSEEESKTNVKESIDEFHDIDMDFKPILTFCGNGPLFRSIESQLVSSVPLDTCEWKRSYGRPVKNVRVEASFQSFDTQVLDKFKSDNWSIIEQPVLHLFVTECDVETYKSSVKEEIDNWLKILGNYGISDWMILLVETVDIKKSKNILPRTTVVDKMRLDFGAKHADRCISVLNPIKFEMKATESFRCLLQRIRFLMLTGYNRNIVKYEELIRTNREKRNQEGWSFIKYFLLQEQLAFVLEKLGLHMEALVQYDELDAMLSQFILNSVFGEKHSWLKAFERQINDFNGITMNAKKMTETRKRIVDGTASILEFRSYVFERQAVLLNASDRQWEIAERLLPFLFATLREIEALKNETPEGALSCWQFVCALEVLNVCEQAVESKDMSNVFHHSAPIWNLAKDKLYELGKLCGLLPGCTPTSEQLHTVVQLSAGIGDSFLDQETMVTNARIPETDRSHSPKRQLSQSSSERLKEALGSNQSFQKLYLELSELAISTYKHVCRLRSARLVGLDLGNFYCTLSKPQKAVVFFTDLLRELKAEKWNYLASQTLLELASCFRKMEDWIAYTKTCGSISCCLELEVLVRTFYFDEFLLSLKSIKGTTNNDGSIETITNGLEDHFNLLSIDVQNASQIIQDDLIISHIKIESFFPREILASQISMSYNVFDNASIDFTKHSAMLSISLHLDHKQDNSLSSASVVCDSKSKLAMRRCSKLPQNVVRSDFMNEISTKNIVIKPGINIIELKSKATRVGMWSFKQLSIIVDDKIDYLSDVMTVKQTPFEITTKAASAVLSFKNLVAGIKQPVKLIISGGSFIFPKLTNINLKCSKNLKIKSFAEDTFKQEVSIKLENFKSFDERTISLEVICELPGQRDEKYFEHMVYLHCPWSRNEIQIPLHFMPPFVASCRLHSSETRKFLQVIIKGTEATLCLSNATMICDYKGVNLKDQNPKSQNNIQIHQGLSISYLWEIEVEPLKAENELPIIKVNFNVQYAHMDNLNEKRNFVCKFDVQDYTTLFRIHAKIESSELCRVGSVCHLNLSITKVQDSSFGDLMYEVLPDQHIWAVCGRTAGVISSEGQSVILDILPLCAGFLPMPNIRLSKYIPAGRNEIHPKLEPFPPGQVYNATKSVQVHVLASTTAEAN